jgi:hypothetical protein
MGEHRKWGKRKRRGRGSIPCLTHSGGAPRRSNFAKEEAPAVCSVPVVPVLVTLAWGWHRGGAGGDEAQEGAAGLVARGYRGSVAAR